MLLSQEITLPCGLQVRNRLAKAAMAENIATNHKPGSKHVNIYKEWADGGWGMVLTGNIQVSDAHVGSPGDVAIPTQASANPTVEEQRIWKEWATTTQASGAVGVVQLCHPGRQSPGGVSKRGFFEKALAPSAVRLNLGSDLFSKAAVALIFGTPKAMTVEEIEGERGVIQQFVVAAKQCYEAGFRGVELHGAHGYLLAQFLSPTTNLRNDDYGGTPTKRAEIVVRVIKATRAATSPSFCIGIKLNSVDASTSESLDDTLEQIRLIVDAGIDFIEISGGSYENARMITGDSVTASTVTGTESTLTKDGTSSEAPAKESTLKREAFFLSFAHSVRAAFPSVILMVTGGFRTRLGMEAALQSGGCDLIGVGRPATVYPKLPGDIILNESVSDADATVVLEKVKVPFLVSAIPIKVVGLGYQSYFYAQKLQALPKSKVVKAYA